ncbi:MAG: hypothetical protein ACLF0G_00435 [Candidatus Brocadiia bacterium]
MPHRSAQFRRLLFGVAFLVVAARPALAYIDPGTGSYILQIVLACAVGSAFAVKMFWRRIKLFVLGLFAKADSETPDDE